jgi:hypothetical protein
MNVFHLQLVDFVVDHVVHLGVETSWQALLTGELVECCEEQQLAIAGQNF